MRRIAPKKTPKSAVTSKKSRKRTKFCAAGGKNARATNSSYLFNAVVKMPSKPLYNGHNAASDSSAERSETGAAAGDDAAGSILVSRKRQRVASARLAAAVADAAEVVSFATVVSPKRPRGKAFRESEPPGAKRARAIASVAAYVERHYAELGIPLPQPSRPIAVREEEREDRVGSALTRRDDVRRGDGVDRVSAAAAQEVVARELSACMVGGEGRVGDGEGGAGAEEQAAHARSVRSPSLAEVLACGLVAGNGSGDGGGGVGIGVSSFPTTFQDRHHHQDHQDVVDHHVYLHEQKQQQLERQLHGGHSGDHGTVLTSTPPSLATPQAFPTAQSAQAIALSSSCPVSANVSSYHTAACLSLPLPSPSASVEAQCPPPASGEADHSYRAAEGGITHQPAGLACDGGTVEEQPQQAPAVGAGAVVSVSAIAASAAVRTSDANGEWSNRDELTPWGHEAAPLTQATQRPQAGAVSCQVEGVSGEAIGAPGGSGKLAVGEGEEGVEIGQCGSWGRAETASPSAGT